MTNEIKGKKVLVTGGAGFIGSHLCTKLTELGAEVISIDNFSAGKKENLDHLRDYKNFTSLNKDICDTDGFENIFDGLTYVFNNAASKKNICLVNPHRDLEVNAGGTLNLLNLSKKFKIKRFVHASTGSVYGEPTIFPTDETHPLKPVSYYGVSKLAGERYVDTFNHLYGMETTILRYFHVYGPRQESNEFGGVVSIFLRQIIERRPITVFGDGDQTRSFTYVNDLVDANIAAATSPNANNKVYNAASGIKVSINDPAKNLLNLMKSEDLEIQHLDPLIGDIRYFDVDNKKIIRDLNLKFEKDFWGTMKKTTDEYMSYFSKLGILK